MSQYYLSFQLHKAICIECGRAESSSNQPLKFTAWKYLQETKYHSTVQLVFYIIGYQKCIPFFLLAYQQYTCFVVIILVLFYILSICCLLRTVCSRVQSEPPFIFHTFWDVSFNSSLRYHSVLHLAITIFISGKYLF